MHRQEASFSEAFMQVKDKTAIHIKRQAEVGASEACSSTDGGGTRTKGISGAKRLRKGKFNFDRDAPRLDKAMDADLKRVDKSLEKVIVSYDKLVATLAAEPVGSIVSDRALGSYVKGLQFRRQLVYRFQDDIQTVVSGADLSIVSETTDATAAASGSALSADESQNKSAPSSPRSVYSVSSCRSTATSVRSRSVLQLVDENASRKPFEGDAADFRSRSQLDDLKGKVYDAHSEDVFDDLEGEWGRAVKIVEQLMGSLQQSLNDANMHVSTKRRDKARSEKAAQAQKQMDELKRVRDEAKQKAEEIKKKHEDAKQPVVDPIYLAALADLPAVIELAEDDAQRDWDQPWVIRSSESAQLWSGDAPVQRVLAAWGAGYKKDKSCAEVGRAQRMMDNGAAKDSTVTFLQKHSPPNIMDLSAIEGIGYT